MTMVLGAGILSVRCLMTIPLGAYGYRSAETFKLALYHGLGNLSMPQLTHRFL